REVAQLPTPTIPTRTEPIGLSSLLCCGGLGGLTGLVGLLRAFGGLLAGVLCGDQLGEPAHLPLDGLQAVALELDGVPVDVALGPVDLGLDPVEPLLQPRSPAFEDAQPAREVGAREEREPDVER